MLSTRALLETTDFPEISRHRLEVIQVNLGYLCNLQCLHCHVNAGPKRKEIMSRETIDQVLQYLAKTGASKLDLTGGAPELNPDFKYLVSAARTMGVEVIDRCNLTVLNETGNEDLAEFLADNEVHVVASMPCYLSENVDRQRGKGTFSSSVKALQSLNELGYGRSDSSLVLDLVYNAQGASLPPPQIPLEKDYKERLGGDHGVVFNQLFTITNMPIQRFGSMLISNGEFEPYMDLLRNAYREENLETVMCRTQLSIDWMGHVYDCDFNQMLEMPLPLAGHPRPHLSDLLRIELEGKGIAVGEHCYGCTAGQGSSCGGALNE